MINNKNLYYLLMRHEEIESSADPWKGSMLPLHQ